MTKRSLRWKKRLLAPPRPGEDMADEIIRLQDTVTDLREALEQAIALVPAPGWSDRARTAIAEAKQ